MAKKNNEPKIKALKTKAEAVEKGAKVVASKPRNMFDPDKWPKPTLYPYTQGSYCEKRVCHELGLKAEDNRIAIVGGSTPYGGTSRIWMPLFRSDQNDNIEILVYTLDRELIPLERTTKMGQTEQQSDNTRDSGIYKLIRLHPDNIKENGAKYLCPSKQQSAIQYPYIPIQLLEKWEKREEIETLVITEGFFKAFKACMCGADVIGIGGITMFTDTSTGGIHRDIKRVIIDCKVKKVVFLHDGDCLDISKSLLESPELLTSKDASERPRNFRNTVTKFFQVYKPELPNVEIYWSYVNSSAISDNPKGLDDLLVTHPEEADRVVYDLGHPELITSYFNICNLNKERAALDERFFLDSAQSFYNRHKEELGTKKFIFCGTVYKWNSFDKKLEEIISQSLLALKRIGQGWYKEVRRPTIGKDANGNTIYVTELTKWSRQNIIDDFGKDVLGKLMRYEGFVNMPSHDNYQKIIGSFYNMYNPIPHQPSAEDLRKIGWKTIRSTMEHIFGKDNLGRGLRPGDAGYDPDSQYELGMDYVQLLYQQPTQNLPILCLVSTERGTGKTSFLDLMHVMFGDNAVIVGNDQVTSKFNTLVTGRLVVGVDETSLADNKEFTEKLKMWSTAKKLPREGKGVDAELVDNYTKYILCSNNERRFIYASSEEVRFWVRKVPVFSKDQQIGNVLPFYKEEMGAFMAYLNDRDLYFNPGDKSKLDRMYFPPAMLHTKWLDELLEAQRPRAERKMREWLRQWFIDFGIEQLLTTIDKLQEAMAITDRKFGNYDLEDLRRLVTENMRVRQFEGGKSKRFKFPVISNVVYDKEKQEHDSNAPCKQMVYGNGRPYAFYAKDFLNDEEYMSVFHRPKDDKAATMSESAAPISKPENCDEEEEIPDVY